MKELLESIRRVVEGGTQIKAALLHTAVENLIQNGRKTLAERTTEAAHLTEREVDILRLMGNGDSNKIMAETLGITLDTTKKHVRNVIDKLQARSRTHGHRRFTTMINQFLAMMNNNVPHTKQE